MGVERQDPASVLRAIAAQYAASQAASGLGWPGPRLTVAISGRDDAQPGKSWHLEADFSGQVFVIGSGLACTEQEAIDAAMAVQRRYDATVGLLTESLSEFNGLLFDDATQARIVSRLKSLLSILPQLAQRDEGQADEQR